MAKFIRRLLTWSLLSFAAIILVLAAAAFIMLRTAPGQRYVLKEILPRLAAETGVTIEIGGVGGAWPAQMRLSKVRLSDADGVWFEAERISVVWRPALALSGRYVIDTANIAGGHMLREPNIPGSGRKHEGAKHYPFLHIGGIDAPDLVIDEPVLDQALAFDLKGSVELQSDGSVIAPLDIRLATADLVSGKLAKILGEKVHLITRITGTAGKAYALGAFSAESADGKVRLGGSGSYDVATRAIGADLKGPVAPGVAAEISPKLSAKGPAQIAVSGRGPWKSLQIALAADLSALDYDGSAISPSRLDAKLVLQRHQLDGPVRIVFADGARGAAGSVVAGNFNWDRKAAIKVSALASDYRGARINGDVAFDMHADTIHAALSFDIANLGVLPLPLKASGPLQGKAIIDDGATTDIDIAAKSAQLVIEGTSFVDFSAMAKGALENARVEITARSVKREALGSATAFSVSGGFARENGATRIAFDQLALTFGKAAVSLAAPTTLSIGADTIALAATEIRWGEKGRIRASGSLGKEIVANFAIEGVELPEAPLVAGGDASIDSRKEEMGRLSVKLTPLKGAGLELHSDIEGRWSGGRLALTGAIEGYGADAAFTRVQPVTLSIPLKLDRRGGKLAFNTEGPIEGRVRYKGPIDRFLLLAPLAEQTLKGAADLDIAASGTLKDPHFAGRASLQNGTYENAADGIFFDRLNAQGQVEHTGDVYVLSLDVSASDGRGGASVPIKAKGVMQLGVKPRIDASLHLDHARLIHTQQLTFEASGDVKLDGTLPALAASGAITVHNVEFQIPNALPPDIVRVMIVPVDANGQPIAPEVKPQHETPVTVALNVVIAAKQQVYIRGRGLDSEWSTVMKVTGTVEDPRLDGDLTLRRGSFDLSGRRFDLSQGSIHFIPSRTSDPDLAIQARSGTASGATAIINVTGKSSHPEIKLTSDPPLPPDDVMSLVLFGRPAEQLSALQAVQVANAIATLTGESPFSKGPGILDRARTSLGLDLLDVSMGEEGAGVTVGKYVRRGVFVSGTPGIGGKPGSVAAAIDVSKSISVETSVGQDAQESVGVQWKHDY